MTSILANGSRPARPVRRLLALAVTVVSLVATAGVPVGRADEPSVTVLPDIRCERPPAVDPKLVAPVPDGFLEHLPYQEWLASDAGQAANTRINEVVEGDPTVLGVLSDDVNQRLIVVVDPAFGIRQGLGAELLEAAGNDIEVVLQVGCRPRSAVDGIEEELLARDWHPNASKIAFAFWFDAAFSAIVVEMSPELTDEADALRQRWGDLVVIQPGTFTRLGPLDDGNPHHGGARRRI